MDTVTVVGGGLAGCEAARQIARAGIKVDLYEMRRPDPGGRPAAATPAHATDLLAELVCSNSLKSTETVNAHGLLKAELEQLGSLVISCAQDCRVPAGKALAVDRQAFAQAVTDRITSDPMITVIGGEMAVLPDGPAVICTGPLTSEALANSIAALAGKENLFFYDAIAPIVSADSLDHAVMFRASRYSAEEGEYWNVPLTKEQYRVFVQELASARRHHPHGFEFGHFFEGCLPIEVMASRDQDALRFGPMKPVGLFNPHEGRRPYAVVQLRQENRAATMYNLVGFQTQLAQDEQRRVLRMLPGLGAAEFMRCGAVHRNTYLNGPATVAATMQSKTRGSLFFAGQLTGVEGYVESAASGLWAGINMARMLMGKNLLTPPVETICGALFRYVAESDASRFQPMNANFGLLPPLEDGAPSRIMRKQQYAKRSLAAMNAFIHEHQLDPTTS